MIKSIIFSIYIFISSIIVVSAQQLNLDDTYESSIQNAYGLTDVPLPPGKWKVYDLEEVGTVDSGDFFVYASLMPANVSEAERRYNDDVSVNLFGPNSEETEYRKSFFVCEGGWFNNYDIMKIDKRPDGTFEESCAVNLADPTVNTADVGNDIMQYHITECSDSCIEFFYTLNADNYRNDKESFVEIGNSIFQNVRNITAGKPGSLSFISDYKN